MPALSVHGPNPRPTLKVEAIREPPGRAGSPLPVANAFDGPHACERRARSDALYQTKVLIGEEHQVSPSVVVFRCASTPHTVRGWLYSDRGLKQKNLV